MRKALLMLFVLAVIAGIALFPLPTNEASAASNVTLVYYGFDG